MAYDAWNAKCMGGVMKDLNYVDYSSAAYQTMAKAQNLTIPKDYYLVYVPQKYKDSWNYKDSICQNNKTMCTAGRAKGASGGAVGGAVGGVVFLCCVGGIVYCCCCKKGGEQAPAPEPAPAKVEEHMVDPGQ
jgi:hypothetical protein